MFPKIVYKWGPVNFKMVPIKGRVVHVGLQNGDVFVWTEQEVNLDIVYHMRWVRLYPTGVEYAGQYCGTVIMPSGLVWHVVEVDSQ
jgi:hypothetical protein